MSAAVGRQHRHRPHRSADGDRHQLGALDQGRGHRGDGAQYEPRSRRRDRPAAADPRLGRPRRRRLHRHGPAAQPARGRGTGCAHAVRHDRARIQIGKISRFGLLELSRQRLRPSLEESTQSICPRCSGAGNIRSVESLALAILRLVGEEARKERTAKVIAQLPMDVANYVLNEKRDWVQTLQEANGVHSRAARQSGSRDAELLAAPRARRRDRRCPRTQARATSSSTPKPDPSRRVRGNQEAAEDRGSRGLERAAEHAGTDAAAASRRAAARAPRQPPSPRAARHLHARCWPFLFGSWRRAPAAPKSRRRRATDSARRGAITATASAARDREPRARSRSARWRPSARSRRRDRNRGRDRDRDRGGDGGRDRGEPATAATASAATAIAATAIATRQRQPRERNASTASVAPRAAAGPRQRSRRRAKAPGQGSAAARPAGARPAAQGPGAAPGAAASGQAATRRGQARERATRGGHATSTANSAAASRTAAAATPPQRRDAVAERRAGAGSAPNASYDAPPHRSRRRAPSRDSARRERDARARRSRATTRPPSPTRRASAAEPTSRSPTAPASPSCDAAARRAAADRRAQPEPSYRAEPQRAAAQPRAERSRRRAPSRPRRSDERQAGYGLARALTPGARGAGGSVLRRCSSRPAAASSTRSSTCSKPVAAAVVRIGHLAPPEVRRELQAATVPGRDTRPGTARAGTPRFCSSIASTSSKCSKSSLGHAPRAQRLEIDATALGGAACARIGRRAHVIRMRARRIDLHVELGRSLREQLAKHALGRRRAADVAHADEQNAPRRERRRAP